MSVSPQDSPELARIASEPNVEQALRDLAECQRRWKEWLKQAKVLNGHLVRRAQQTDATPDGPLTFVRIAEITGYHPSWLRDLATGRGNRGRRGSNVAHRVKRDPETGGLVEPTAAAVRAWARENGFQVKPEGRLSPRVLAAYAEATGRDAKAVAS